MDHVYIFQSWHQKVTSIKIAHETTNTYKNTHNYNEEITMNMTVVGYNDTRLDCSLQCIGQTRSSLKAWFNEYSFTIKCNKDTSTYAQYILNIGHSYTNIQDTM